jgi:hypothetical protein
MEARGNQPQATDGLRDVVSAGGRLDVPRKGGPFFSSELTPAVVLSEANSIKELLSLLYRKYEWCALSKTLLWRASNEEL